MVPNQTRRKVHEYNYVECVKVGHEYQELSMICMDSQCKGNRLSCCHCESQDHLNHKLIPLKEYFLHIYQQKINANFTVPTDTSQNYLTGYQSLEKQSPKFYYLSYLQSIEDKKVLIIKKLHSIKEEIIEQITLLETQITINTNKYIEKIKLISQLYFSKEDIVQKLTNFSQNPKKIEHVLEEFIQNFLPPQQKDFNPFIQTPKIETAQNPQQNQKHSHQNQYCQIHESFDKKISNLEKSLQKFDFTFFSKLHKMIEYQNFKFTNFSNYEWDPLYKAEGFEITDPENKIMRVKVKSNDEQRVALMKNHFLKNSKNKCVWAVKISKLNGWIGVGLALRKVVVKAQYKFNYSATGHGMYMLSANGYTWSHSEAENNSKNQGFSFLTGDVVVMQFNQLKRQLSFKKIDGKEGNPTKILKIAEFQNEDFLCPCVNMLSKNDEVEIVPVPGGFFF